VTVHTRHWQYGSLRFRFTSSHVEAVTWVEAFLEGTFTPLQEGVVDHVVELRCDASAHAALTHRVKALGAEPREGFASDTKRVLMDTWPDADGTRLARDAETGVFFRIAPGARQVDVHAAESGRAAWLAAVKVLRELAMEGVARTGGTLVHCAALDTNAGTVLLSGPRGSGKTTLMCAMTMCGAARYVTNDRAVLRVDAETAQVHGVPTLVSIREGTLELLPGLRRRAEAHGHVLDHARNLHLAPQQFCALTSAARVGGGDLLALVYPRTQPGLRGWTLTKLTAAEGAARFATGLFRAGRDTSLGEVFVADVHAARRIEPARIAQEASRWVVAHGRLIDLSIGAGFVPDRDECDRILSAIYEAVRP
jgi:energy-coupling factor transporter ATP-binding protein EcfA2